MGGDRVRDVDGIEMVTIITCFDGLRGKNIGDWWKHMKYYQMCIQRNFMGSGGCKLRVDKKVINVMADTCTIFIMADTCTNIFAFGLALAFAIGGSCISNPTLEL